MREDHNCFLCDVPTNGTIFCDDLCHSLHLYKVFDKESWRNSVLPDSEKWKLWVYHRYGTPLEEVEEFSY